MEWGAGARVSTGLHRTQQQPWEPSHPGLKGRSGAQSQARREGSLSGPVTEAGHPDGGQKGRPRKTPYPSSPWVMPLSSGHPDQMSPAVHSAGPPPPTEASPAPCSSPASSGLLRPLLPTGSQPTSPQHTQAAKAEQMPP